MDRQKCAYYYYYYYFSSSIIKLMHLSALLLKLPFHGVRLEPDLLC